MSEINKLLETILPKGWNKDPTLMYHYSLWLNIFSIILTLVNIVIPYMGLLQPLLSVEVYGWTMFILNVLAGASKFIKQNPETEVK